ncbi:uncharacterized protein LOC110737478 [Chenopodium quinoa]|uniref:uncharacterized protein LOC110737478 n=1 Tax=Chenopodium quinoa TaxID=63459 RepID=UPI000B77B2AD|nr:uncharacterized protein LOC110737478 [Chenopodium quinoa]
MADDHYRIGVEDVEVDDDDSSGDGDEMYDVNKEPDLGEAEDQAQDVLDRMLDEFEIAVEQAPPIENAMSESFGEDQSGGGVKGPAQKKLRGPTTSFKKPVGPMVLEYDRVGQPIGKWRRQYAVQVGICARKIPITLRLSEVPTGLIDTFWNDTGEIREQNSKNALQKQYHHRMGCMTYDEWRETWVSEGVYPTSLLGSSTVPSDSTTSTLVSRAGDFFCSLHSRDKKTGKWSIKAPETKEMADKLL